MLQVGERDVHGANMGLAHDRKYECSCHTHPQQEGSPLPPVVRN